MKIYINDEPYTDLQEEIFDRILEIDYTEAVRYLNACKADNKTEEYKRAVRNGDLEVG